MNILVSGGAGYIGSACVKKLIEKGDKVIVVDNLSKGKKELVDEKAEFFEGDLIDEEFLEKVFKNNEIDAVIHFAAYKAVGESMKNLEKYNDNIIGTINILDMMVRYSVKKIIFSSSAAVYGEPEYVPVDEKHRLKPINYYGFTKQKCEEIIDWYGKLKGIVGISLRYFNVSGDAGLNYIDPEAENVFPIIMEVFTGERDKFVIFGNDYDTFDGTCVRDYIDINDLVDAHILSLDLDKSEIINLGSSNGTSVKELVEIFEEVCGKELKKEIGGRREGDPAKLTASAEKAEMVLGWRPKRSVKDMVKSTVGAYGK